MNETVCACLCVCLRVCAFVCPLPPCCSFMMTCAVPDVPTVDLLRVSGLVESHAYGILDVRAVCYTTDGVVGLLWRREGLSLWRMVWQC